MHTYIQLILTSALAFVTGCNQIAPSLIKSNPKVNEKFAALETDRTITGRAWTNTIGEGSNAIPVLHLEGNNFSFGYHHARLFAKEIKTTAEEAFKGTEKFIPKKAAGLMKEKSKLELVNWFLDKTWETMAPNVPYEDLAEMEGIAKGLYDAKVFNLEETEIQKIVHRLHSIPDLGESCSALVAVKNATTDGHAYQLRILDYGANLGLNPLIIIYHDAGVHKITFMDVSWMGFVGVVTGMNKEGVAMSEMRYKKVNNRTLHGRPMIFVMKDVLRSARTAREGAAIVATEKRTNGFAYWLGDSSGDAIGILASAGEYHEYSINSTKEVKDGNTLLPQYTDVIYGGHYSQKQSELVRQTLGKLNVETIQKMAKEIRMPSNLTTAIFDLETREAWIAERRADIPAADCGYAYFPAAAWQKK